MEEHEEEAAGQARTLGALPCGRDRLEVEVVRGDVEVAFLAGREEAAERFARRGAGDRRRRGTEAGVDGERRRLRGEGAEPRGGGEAQTGCCGEGAAAGPGSAPQGPGRR